MRALVIVLLLLAGACSSAATSADEALPEIVLPISLHVVVDQEADGASSARTVDELAAIGQRMRDIWGQAGINLEISLGGFVAAPATAIAAIDDRDVLPFLRAASSGDITVEDAALISGFYVPGAGGANGFAPRGTRTFFVIDEPSVNDERVSSHEIGHILGLHHTLVSRDRLMFSGTNGTELTAEEIAVARYVAQGLLDDLR